MSLPVADRWYEIDQCAHGVALVKEIHVHEFARSNIWLVRGSRHALLVDTGTGLGPLRAMIESVTDRPITAFATVGYYDHAGGLHQFDSRVVHRLDADRVSNPSPRKVVSERYVTDRAFKALPRVGFAPVEYRMTGSSPTRLVEDGDQIDLGDRSFEVIHLPGVTPGASGLFERETGILFTGEALSFNGGHLYDGEPAEYTDDADRSAFKMSLERMLRLPVKQVYPGHYEPFDGAQLTKVIGDYLAGRTRSRFG